MGDAGVLRMIDANANRAREAARVLEDVARFALDDEELASGCKALRHALREALAAAGLESGALLGARDTPGDVGSSVTTEGERRRDDLAGVAAAAGKRLGEALRVLEETLKLIQEGAGAAAAVKSLRYEAYELERRIVLALTARGRAPQWRVCVLITEALCTQLGWEDVAARSIRGGAECLQLREKTLPDAELLRRARRLVEIASSTPLPAPHAAPARAAVIVNDRPDIALLAGAAGVHLGQEDLPVRDVRRLDGGQLIVGVSTASLDQGRRAIEDGADYVGLGPMFPSATKPKERLAGLEYLREFVKFADARARETGRDPVPHLAISGITPANAGEVAAAGGRGVAVSAAVCGAAEPERVCRDLLGAMQAGAGR